MKERKSGLIKSIANRLSTIREGLPPLVFLMSALLLLALLGGLTYGFIQARAGNLFFLYSADPWGRGGFIHSDSGEQTLLEGIVCTIFLGLAMVGCYLIFKSSQCVYRVREGWILLLIGIGLVVVAYICLMSMAQVKVF